MKIDFMEEPNKKEQNSNRDIPKTKILFLGLFLVFTILITIGSFYLAINTFLDNKPNEERLYNSGEVLNISGKPGIISEMKYEKNDMGVKFEEVNINTGARKEIGYFELKSHNSIQEIKKVGAGEQVVMYYDFNFNEFYPNGIGTVEFRDMNTGQLINRDYSFVYWGTSQRDIYETQCDDNGLYENGSINQECSSVKIGVEDYETWLPYNTRDIPKGNIRIGLKTNVDLNDYVDGVWIIGGQKIDRHASWQASLDVNLRSYYKFNETTGTRYDSLGLFNATLSGGTLYTASGKIDSAVAGDGSNYLDAGNVIYNTPILTVSFWALRTSVGNNNIGWMGGAEEWRINYNDCSQTAQDRISVTINGECIDPTNWTGIGDNSWKYYVISVNGNTGNRTYYFNGVPTHSVIGNTFTSLDSKLSFLSYNQTTSPSVSGFNLDEVGIWNRTLTSAEVSTLYNNGDGLQYQQNITESNLIINVTLNSPVDDYQIDSDNNTIVFNSSATISNGNFTNTTLYVWNSSGGIYNTNFTVRNGTSNYSIFYLGNIAIGNYEWNYLWCGVNITSTLCKMQSTNRSFSIIPFSITNESYNLGVYETNNETFLINISTISNILSTSINLNYDNNTYFVETNCVSGLCELIKIIDIPLVTSGETQQKSFFWELRLFGTDGTVFNFNTTTRHQNVSRLHLEVSNATYSNHTLNFTIYDERNRTRLNPMSFASTFQYWSGGGSVRRNVSIYNVSTNEMDISLSPRNLTFYTEAFIEYNAVGIHNGTYNTRNYHFQNAKLTNVTQHIKLFLLDMSHSTSFIQRVTDTSQIATTRALIFAQRYYPDDDTFETVSITKTDGSGESIGFYEVEIPDYRHIITKNGTVLKITERGKVFPQSAPYTLTFIIGETLETIWTPFEGIDSLVSNLSYNKVTKIVSYTWIDTTGALSIANLTVELIHPSRANQVICAKSSVITSGTLNCNVTGQNGTLTASGWIGRSPSVLDKVITFTVATLQDAFGEPFLFLWILLLITAIASGLFFPPAGIVLTGVVVVLGSMLGIVSVGWIFVWAIIGVAIFVLWETS